MREPKLPAKFNLVRGIPYVSVVRSPNNCLVPLQHIVIRERLHHSGAPDFVRHCEQ